jgi:peptide/nickel transport system ATP-binding protein
MTESLNPPLLDVKHLDVRFRTGAGRTTHAVRDVSFTVPARRTVALVGESGSGKSVSAMSLLGLLDGPNVVYGEQTSIRFDGRELQGLAHSQWLSIRGHQISMIFQDPMVSLNPVFTVGDQITEVLRQHLQIRGQEAEHRAEALLREVGIADPGQRLRAYPHQLSGGQQQRVMIAMALACRPRLLIADEPTTALDVTVQRQIMELMLQLQREREMAMLFITHDLGVVGEMADEAIVMRHGQVQEAGSVEQIFTRPQHPYTRALLACRPGLTAAGERLQTVEDKLGGQGAGRAPALLTSSGEQRLRKPLARVEVRHLRKVFQRKTGLFRKQPFVAVEDLSFVLEPGKTLGLVGESGSGKTTAGLCVLRLQPATAGEVVCDGKDLLAMSAGEFAPYKRDMQIVFQNPYASLNPRMTVGDILQEPMLLHGLGADRSERLHRAQMWLERVGLPPAAVSRYPFEFSGGQRQRIAIARCLTLSPSVVVLDEAVSALDVSVQAQVLNLLKDLQNELNLSYLFISHDLGVVRYMSDEVLVMRNGQVIEQGDADRIYAHPQQGYTRDLLNAVPRGYRGDPVPV